MRKFIMAAVAVASLAVPAIAPALASAKVDRYQTETATLTANLLPPTERHHQYNIEINPCTNTFTGSADTAATGYDESISGTIVGDKVTFTSVYGPGSSWAANPYLWGVNDATLESSTDAWDSWHGVYPTIVTLSNVVSSNYKNHGDFVSSQPDRDDAAHSCIGMPINSSN